MWRISAVPDRGRGSVLPPFNTSPPPLSILPLPPLLSRQVQEKAQCRFYLLSHPAPPAPPLAAPRAGSCGGGTAGGVRRRRRRRQLLPQGAAGAGRLRGAVRLVRESSARRLKRHTGCSARTVLHGRHERQRTPIPAFRRKARDAEKAQAGTWTGVPVAGRRQNGQAVQATGIRRLCPPFIKECGWGISGAASQRTEDASVTATANPDPGVRRTARAPAHPTPDGQAGTGSFYRRLRRYEVACLLRSQLRTWHIGVLAVRATPGHAFPPQTQHRPHLIRRARSHIP